MFKLRDDFCVEDLQIYGFRKKFSEYNGKLFMYKHKEFRNVYVTLDNKKINLFCSDGEDFNKFLLLIYTLTSEKVIEVNPYELH